MACVLEAVCTDRPRMNNASGRVHEGAPCGRTDASSDTRRVGRFAAAALSGINSAEGSACRSLRAGSRDFACSRSCIDGAAGSGGEWVGTLPQAGPNRISVCSMRTEPEDGRVALRHRRHVDGACAGDIRREPHSSAFSSLSPKDRCRPARRDRVGSRGLRARIFRPAAIRRCPSHAGLVSRPICIGRMTRVEPARWRGRRSAPGAVRR